ncbi:MAG: biosynthetic peptidoglycan transglycosylase [Gemmatimonadales bacterium]
MAGLLLAAAVAGWRSRSIRRSSVPCGEEGLTLLARDGTVLRSTRASDGGRQRWMPLADLDPDLLVAFVAAEDRRFYRHHGVDPFALARAVRQNLANGRVVSGASTISMQVARLVTGTPRTWFGKVRQAAWAIRLDAHWSKQTLLESSTSTRSR